MSESTIENSQLIEITIHLNIIFFTRSRNKSCFQQPLLYTPSFSGKSKEAFFPFGLPELASVIFLFILGASIGLDVKLHLYLTISKCLKSSILWLLRKGDWFEEGRGLPGLNRTDGEKRFLTWDP